MKYIALFVVCCPLVWCLLSFFINLWEDIIWRFSYPSVLWVVYGIALISIFLDFIVNVCILYILGNTVVLNNVTGDFFCIGIIISFFLVPIIYQSSIHPDDEFNTTYTQVSINILDSFSIIAVTVGNIVLNKLTESSILSSITQYTIYFKDIFGVEPNNDRNSVNLAKESVRHSLQRKSGGHSQEHKPEQEDARKGEEDNEEKGVGTIQVHIDNNVHDNAEKSLGKHFRKRNLGTNEQEEKEDKENEEQKKKSVQDFKDLEKAHHHNTNRNDEVLKHTLKQVGKFATGLLKDDGLTIQGVKIEKRFFVLMENIIERGLDEFDFRNENSASAQFRFALRVKLTINLLSTLLFIFYSSIYLSAPNGCYSFVLFLTMLNFLNNFTSATCIKVHDDTVIKVYSNDEFDLNLSMGKFQGFNHLQFYGTTALTLFNLIFRISITSKPTP